MKELTGTSQRLSPFNKIAMFMQDGTYLTPKFANSWVSSAMPPGLSDTTTENLNKRPSAANPLSITRPRTVESMLPPQRGETTLNQ